MSFRSTEGWNAKSKSETLARRGRCEKRSRAARRRSRLWAASAAAIAARYST